MSGLRSQMVLNFGDGGSVARALELLGCYSRGGRVYQDHEEAWYDPCGHFQLVDTRAKNMATATAEISFGRQASKTRQQCETLNARIEEIRADVSAHSATRDGMEKQIAIGELGDAARMVHDRKTAHLMKQTNALIAQRTKLIRDCADKEFRQQLDDLNAELHRRRSAMTALPYTSARETYEKALASVRMAKANGYDLTDRESKVQAAKDWLVDVRQKLQTESAGMWNVVVELRRLSHWVAGLQADEEVTGQHAMVVGSQPIGKSLGSVDHAWVLPFHCTPVYESWQDSVASFVKGRKAMMVDDDAEQCLLVGLSPRPNTTPGVGIVASPV